MAMDQGGNPVANVKFALWLSYTDGSSSHMSEVVTTPADGKAIITIPKANYSSVELMMQPPSNLGSIRFFSDIFDAQRDENLEFELGFLVKPASAVLSIKNPGGSVAAPGTLIAHRGNPADDAPYLNLRVIDPTQFGLGIGGGGQVASSPAWVTGETYGMDIWPAAGFDCNNLASRSYGFTFDGSNPRQVTFKNTDQSILTPVNGVVTLTLDSPKVTGKLLKHDGTALTLTSGMSGYVTFNEVSENGSPLENANYFAGSACINADGSWGMKPRADGSSHYVKVQYSIGGSLTTPTFIGDQIIHIAANGQYDNVYGLGSGSTSATVTIPDINLPQPNIGFTISGRDSQAVLTGSLNIQKIVGENLEWFASSDVNNQFVSASLPVGQYRIEFLPTNPAFAQTTVYVAVSQSGVTAKNRLSDVTPLTPTAPGIYALVLEKTSPVKVRAVTSTGATIDSTQIGYASVESDGGLGYYSEIGTDGLITSYLPAGDYRYRLNPSWENNPTMLQEITILLYKYPS